MRKRRPVSVMPKLTTHVQALIGNMNLENAYGEYKTR